MAKKNKGTGQTDGRALSFNDIKKIVERLPAAMMKMAERQNIKRIGAIKESSGVIIKESMRCGQLAAHLIADIFERERGEKLVSRSCMDDLEYIAFKDALGLLDPPMDPPEDGILEPEYILDPIDERIEEREVA